MNDTPKNYAALTDEQAKARYPDDDDVKGAGDLPNAVLERLREFERLAPNAYLRISRDWEGFLFAEVEGDDRFDVLALTDTGRVGHGGINLPRYFDTLADLLEDDKLRAEARS